MTTIKGYADMLRLHKHLFSEEEHQSFLEIIVQETDRLARMVRDVLELSTIETGGPKIARDWCNIALLVSRTALKCETCLTSDNPVEISVPPALPQVAADHERIERVLINLLHNAVRYSPLGGPISIAARVDGEQVVISVADQGPGIEPESIPLIFTRFYRGAQTGGRHEAGLGLGLAICRGIVEAHGGRIWCDSKGQWDTAYFHRVRAPARTALKAGKVLTHRMLSQRVWGPEYVT